MAMAAVEGHAGEPGLYRDYRLRTIMNERADESADEQDRRHDAPAVVGG
jgi:hypothetical protein